MQLKFICIKNFVFFSTNQTNDVESVKAVYLENKRKKESSLIENKNCMNFKQLTKIKRTYSNSLLNLSTISNSKIFTSFNLDKFLIECFFSSKDSIINQSITKSNQRTASQSSLNTSNLLVS